MFFKLLERNGYNLTISLFKSWFLEKHQKDGRIYKWIPFNNEWNESTQIHEIVEFLKEQNINLHTTYINKDSYRLKWNKKTLPRLFRSDIDALKYGIKEAFKRKEYHLINEQTSDDKINQINQKIQTDLLIKKARAEKEKQAKEKKQKRFQDSIERVKNKENLSE